MGKERRKYVRLDKIYPVEMQLLDKSGNPVSGLLQGFTRDVSREGLCVAINEFSDEHVSSITKGDHRLAVFLNIPFKNKPIKAVAGLVWATKTADPYPQSYLLGLSYFAIDKCDQQHILDYARFSRSFPRVVAMFCVALLLVCVYLFLDNLGLNFQNRNLLTRLARISDQKNQIISTLDKLQVEKSIGAKMLKHNRQTYEAIKKELALLEARKKQEEEKKNLEQAEALRLAKSELERKLTDLGREKSRLEEKLKNFQKQENALEMDLDKIDEERGVLADKSLGLMRQWLGDSQNNRTGLILSYDRDHAFIDVGYTYDQALSAFNYINAGQMDKAGKIFDFFLRRAEKIDNGFANAYDVQTGKISEYISHSGPSIYLGLAALFYEDKTGDKTYRVLAEDIGGWILDLLETNPDGALPGGPKLKWIGTEQNIAAYVYFERLFEKTKEDKYTLAAEKIQGWLKDRGYNKKLKRFNRGANDRMIATDTIALSIMAFGPGRLEEMGVNLDELVGCVEENCKTRVSFENDQGRRVTVNGFDFCSPSSIGRQGTISVEWTSQMIVAYYELAGFYSRKNDLEKGKHYRRLGDYYLSQIEKLILLRSQLGSRTGAGGLPYAADSGVDTGHGWFTPGSDSISAAGTNFAIFAKEQYNMFKR